jgi:uncharacterized protein
MKFTQQNPDGVHVIRRYGADFIQVDAEEIRHSCIVSPTTISRYWPPRGVADLNVDLLAPIFALAPDVVVLSTGPTQIFPRAALRAEFAMRRIGLEVMEVGAACRTYNVLVSEERKVVVAILLP